MKVNAFALLLLLLTGCASSSKFSSNPGAAVVGPGYLEAIAAHPRDKPTQYYYPSFGIRDFQFSADASAPLPNAAGAEVAAFLTYVPEPSPQVIAITGKGYPCLERRGILLFTGAQKY